MTIFNGLADFGGQRNGQKFSSGSTQIVMAEPQNTGEISPLKSLWRVYSSPVDLHQLKLFAHLLVQASPTSSAQSSSQLWVSLCGAVSPPLNNSALLVKITTP